MNRLKIAIAFTFCLQGFPLSGDMDPCIGFKEGTCKCCRSGWTGQDCKTKCPNCGSNFAKNKCETFCRNASFYGPMCDIQCPAACLRNGRCDTSCATFQESKKDNNQGHADSEASRTGASSQSSGPVSFSPLIEGAVTILAFSHFTIAVCLAGFGVYKIVKWMKRWKPRQDKRKSERRTPAESLPLTSIQVENDDVNDSPSNTDTYDVPTQAESLKDYKITNKEISQPIQEHPDGDDDFQLHKVDAKHEVLVHT